MVVLPPSSTLLKAAANAQEARPPAHHRSDIEGLRGVAVLAVMGVHAWPELLRGGFVGVDMFFVLSGFLIASTQWRDIEAGRFSWREFYARRARRLLPALCVVLAACLLAALAAYPSDARQIGRHVAGAAAFATNLVLWREAGYFDASSESKPLLHLWSLGIEEQFYLLWPLLAWAVWRRPRQALALILGLLILSFALNVAFVESRTKGTFFLLPTRAWELLIGVALAWVLHRRPMPAAGLAAQEAGQEVARKAPRWVPAWLHQRRHDVAAWAGAGLLAAAFALLHKDRLFPGWWALLPTLGTALLLAAGPAAWLNRRVLSTRVLVFYGSISYALYLWHWPLLVFPQLLGHTLDTPLRVLVIVASVALAALTTEHVEWPLRFGTLSRHPRIVWRLGGALALLGCAGLALHRSDGLLQAYPAEVRALARAEFGFDFGAYRSAHCFLDLDQGPEGFAADCAPPAGRPALLLWGDSHAASLYPGLRAALPEVGPVHGGAVAGVTLAQLTKARCPPLLEPPHGASAACAETAQHVLAAIARHPPRTVVLAAHWSLYRGAHENESIDLQRLRDTVRRLQELGVGQVVVLGHLPIWSRPLPRVLLTEWRRHGEVPERHRTALDPLASRLDAAVRDAVHGTGARFVSPMETLCNEQGCLVSRTLAGQVWPLAHDESHLTELGSMVLVQRSGALWLN